MKTKQTQKSLQVRILQPVLGDDGVKGLIEQYDNVKFNHYAQQPPSEKLVRLASLSKKLGPAEAARQVGVSAASANYALSKVARYEYLTKD